MPKPKCRYCGKTAKKSVYAGAELGYVPSCGGSKCNGLNRRERELHIASISAPLDYAKYSSGDW